MNSDERLKVRQSKKGYSTLEERGSTFLVRILISYVPTSRHQVAYTCV